MNMDRNVAIAGAAINLAGVIGFAVAMLTGPTALCYISSIFIAWGLVMMNSGFFVLAGQMRKLPRCAQLCLGVCMPSATRLCILPRSQRW